MNYLFEEGTGKKFLLLHGTGGDEHSLIEIARYLDPKSTILSMRGRVQENGLNRFFKRNGLNQFDIQSLEEESDYLLEQISVISAEQNISMADWIIIGYSNGANIAGHILLERDTSLNKAILFHPMSLGVDTKIGSLDDKQIFLSFGKGDPIVSSEAFQSLDEQLKKRGAKLVEVITDTGHQVTIDEIDQARNWLERIV